MVAEMQRKRQAGEPVPSRYEFKGVTKKGDIIYVEVSAAPITYRGKSEYLLYLRDVTERKEAEEVLIRSHKELERLNKAKTKAVNHISHELNTPISVIQGATTRHPETKIRGFIDPCHRKHHRHPGEEYGTSGRHRPRLTRYSGYPRKLRKEWSSRISSGFWQGWRSFRKYPKRCAPIGRPSRDG